MEAMIMSQARIDELNTEAQGYVVGPVQALRKVCADHDMELVRGDEMTELWRCTVTGEEVNLWIDGDDEIGDGGLGFDDQVELNGVE